MAKTKVLEQDITTIKFNDEIIFHMKIQVEDKGTEKLVIESEK